MILWLKSKKQNNIDVLETKICKRVQLMYFTGVATRRNVWFAFLEAKWKKERYD